MEVAVKECFRNHLYQFDGKVYRQIEGGPIGLRLSMAVSRIVMASWDKQLSKLGGQTGWLVHLLKRYVDDVTAVLETLRLGVRWTVWGLSYKPEWEVEDRTEGLTHDQRTMREYQKMANTILPFIQVTFDTVDDHPSKTLPVLDLQCWTEGKVVLHKYYEKPMSSKYCIMEASAMSQNVKWSSLSQEIIRRMKNTSRRVAHDVREGILTDFMLKLQRSGYTESFRKNVLISALKGYSKMKESEDSGKGPINRPRGSRPKRQKTRLSKIREKSEWHKRKITTEVPEIANPLPQGYAGGSHFSRKSAALAKNNVSMAVDSHWDYKTVLFIPQTPNGELASAFREYEKKRGASRRIRIVERAGVSLKQKLFSSNPWAKEGCNREDCFPCKSEGGEGGICRRENLTYKIDCMYCSKLGITKQYWGETSRTLYQYIYLIQYYK